MELHENQNYLNGNHIGGDHHETENDPGIIGCSDSSGWPIRLVYASGRLDGFRSQEILEIVVFNGSSGNATHITDKEQIQHIIDDLNDVEIKRTRPSMGYSGYGYKLSVYLSDGNEAGDWNNFIINSEDTIRKDPFFYSVIKGYIDYNYIENIAE